MRLISLIAILNLTGLAFGTEPAAKKVKISAEAEAEEKEQEAVETVLLSKASRLWEEFLSSSNITKNSLHELADIILDIDNSIEIDNSMSSEYEYCLPHPLQPDTDLIITAETLYNPDEWKHVNRQVKDGI